MCNNNEEDEDIVDFVGKVANKIRHNPKIFLYESIYYFGEKFYKSPTPQHIAMQIIFYGF